MRKDNGKGSVEEEKEEGDEKKKNARKELRR